MDIPGFWQLIGCYVTIGLVLSFIKILFKGKDGEGEFLILLLWPLGLVVVPVFLIVEGLHRFMDFAHKLHLATEIEKERDTNYYDF